ncbi:DJ-1/PfpI family protein [Mycoplasma sp. AC157]
MNNKLLVLVQDDFQDFELTAVTTTLERAKTFSEIIFYNNNESREYIGQHKIVKIQTKKEIDLSEFSAIFIPGGKGATYLRKDFKNLNIVNHFLENKKWIFAICDAPNALFETKIFDDKTEYVGFPNESKKGEKFQDKNIVHFDKIITAKSAFYSLEFSLKIIEIIQGIEIKKQILKQLTG